MNNSTADRIITTLTRARRVLVVTHVRPDGDAIGSCAALVLGLKRAGIPAEVLLLSALPRKYAFLFKDNAIRWFVVEQDWPAELELSRYDVLVSVDTGTWSQLPGLKERVAAFGGKKIVIDHHLTQENWADEKWVDTHAAAAGELIAELLQRWPIEIDAPIASALYIALVSDTGWFQFSNTRPRTLTLAATLMERGADIDSIYQRLYQDERAARVRLMARVLESLELLSDERLAIMTLRQRDFIETRAEVSDSENLINLPLQIATVQVSALVTESPGGGPTRISLRSKGQLDVARFAERFAGGGHARAAGLRIDAPLDAARQTLIPALVEACQ